MILWSEKHNDRTDNWNAVRKKETICNRPFAIIKKKKKKGNPFLISRRKKKKKKKHRVVYEHVDHSIAFVSRACYGIGYRACDRYSHTVSHGFNKTKRIYAHTTRRRRSDPKELHCSSVRARSGREWRVALVGGGGGGGGGSGNWGRTKKFYIVHRIYYYYYYLFIIFFLLLAFCFVRFFFPDGFFFLFLLFRLPRQFFLRIIKIFTDNLIKFRSIPIPYIILYRKKKS